MCLIVFAYEYHRDYKLILAANRDEFYRRPALSVHHWDTKPVIIAGQDLSQKGTWLGLNENGRWAAVTNYRDFRRKVENPVSRGLLITEYLQQEPDTADYLKSIQKNAGRYNGFNLLTGNLEELYFYSNIENEIKKLESGIYGLSNKFLDTPWPKVTDIKNELSRVISNGFQSEDLLKIMKNEQQYPDKDLPDTGVGSELEKKLSSVFISMPDYGTRCTSIMLIDRENNVTFLERTYTDGGKSWTDNKIVI